VELSFPAGDQFKILRIITGPIKSALRYQQHADECRDDTTNVLNDNAKKVIIMDGC